jgi:hypothetical protein
LSNFFQELGFEKDDYKMRETRIRKHLKRRPNKTPNKAKT